MRRDSAGECQRVGFVHGEQESDEREAWRAARVDPMTALRLE